MAGAAKEIKLKVTIDEDTRGAVKAGKALDDTGKSADKLDASLKRSGKTAKDFDAEIKRLTEHRAKLISETEDLSDEAFVKERRRISSRISLYKRMQKELEDAAPGGGGGGLTNPFSAGNGIIGKAIANPELIAAAAPVIAAAVIQLGAMVEGALAGGVVAAGLAGGIAAASKDASVRATAEDFGAEISRSFFGSGTAFAGPIRDALNDLEGDFQSLNLGATFAKAAPGLKFIEEGMSDLVSNTMPGFNKIMDKSAAISDILGQGLADTGDALSDLMTDIADSKGTVEGLRAIFELLDGTIKLVGVGLGGLGDAFDATLRFTQGALGGLNEIADWIPGVGWLGLGDDMKDAKKHVDEFLAATDGAGKRIGATGDAARGAATGIAGIGVSAKAAAEALAVQNEQFDKFVNHQMAQQNAAIGWEQSIDDFTDAIMKNGSTMDISTQKGRDNAKAMEAMVENAQRVRQSNLDAGMGADEANKKYSDQIKFIETLSRKLGIAKADIDKLAGTYEINVVVNQTAGKEVVAWSTLRNAERKAAASPQRRAGGFHGFASGGQSPANDWFWVGENGPELTNRQGMVKSHQQSMAMSGGGGGSASAPRPFVLNAPGLGDAIFNEIVRMIQARGGTLGVIGIRP